jgi:CBS-domain-containing membrane protein
MKIADLMTTRVQTCNLNDSLNAAANVMWEHDCGIVPVLDAAGKLVGVLTDRDVCMAAFFHGMRLAELPVREVMARDLHTLRPEAPLFDALELMRRMQVRRLPVVDDEGELVGILSLADVAAAWRRRALVDGRQLREEDVSEVLSAITRSRSEAEPDVLVVEVQPRPRAASAPAPKTKERKPGKSGKGKPKARAKGRKG